MIRFVCTLYVEEIDVRGQLAGRQINCPKCNGVRLVPDKSPKMKFHCHSCVQSVRVEQIYTGKKGYAQNAGR
jgi:transcription elongation factor Elf1